MTERALLVYFRVGAALVFAAVALFLGALWSREARRRR
jgi:hypothetical protein